MTTPGPGLRSCACRAVDPSSGESKPRLQHGALTSLSSPHTPSFRSATRRFHNGCDNGVAARDRELRKHGARNSRSSRGSRLRSRRQFEPSSLFANVLHPNRRGRSGPNLRSGFGRRFRALQSPGVGFERCNQLASVVRVAIVRRRLVSVSRVDRAPIKP